MKMIEIRYSLDEAIDVLGTRKDVEVFRQEVLNFLKTDLEKVHIEIEKEVNSEPWESVAKGLEIIQNDKPVKVSISDEEIIKIEGSKDNLEKLTSFLEFDKNAVSGSHSHYEFYEGNEWITADSIPLIIGIK